MKPVTLKSLALSAVCLGAVGAASAQDAIVHAGHLLAVPGEGYLTEQTITIKEGRIVSVQPGYKSGAKNVPVIDLKNAYVVPGLIDSHVHITSESGPGERLKAFTDSSVDTAFDGAAFAKKTLEAGFTTVQDVGGENDAVFGLRDAIARGAVAGPRMRAAGQAISITGGHGDINGYSSPVLKLFTGTNICNGADDCRRAVRQQVKEGADVIKITATGGVLSNTAAGLEQQFSNDELVAIVEAAHSMGRQVTAHAHGKAGVDAALRAGIDSIEHGTYLDDESIALFKEHKATLVPTVIAGVTVTGWTNEPWLPEASRKKAAIVGPLMLDMLRRAHAGGVNVAFGTDTGVSQHGLNAKEFALMVEAGFTPEEAIRAATVSAAKHLEMDGDIGTIEPGKYADIVAVTADPLKKITELESVDFVMQGGKVYKALE
ncbi:metal-dependent hydrolase family protein [Hyphomonas oceanitis]|uniref:Amidohydrolase family protein n=1 Tax=Hyphomonas oceanitis SCH89 TaxID=1280953 RepID=A0A059G631_9PROT|nr:amidohydrolase family protein [Hyphomonas oceanitis]KDA02194.1 amidohydrolase family protein [Hyphomonas oceanitis SCH89]